MGYAAYPNYKSSRIDWVDRIPSHWNESCLKHYYDIRLGKMLQPKPTSAADIEVSYLRAANVRWGSVDIDDLPTMWATPDELPRFSVRQGDLLVCEGGEVGRASILGGVEYPCIIQNALHRIRSTERSDTHYLKYLIRHIADSGWFSILCNKATIAHLTGEKLASIGLPLAPIDEQQAIVRFLDHKTAQIDALIAKKEALLQKLAEKRTTLISHAVTKGFDPAVPLKRSGVEWIGNIPQHWTTRRIKFAAKLESGHTPSKQVPEYWEDCNIPWVSLNDSKQLAASDYISDTAIQINSLGLANSSARLLPADAVVFTRDATIGLCAITTRPMAVSQHLIAWIPGSDITPLYLLRVFNAMKAFLDSFTFGATIKTIGMPDVKKLAMPIPPLHEQQAITEYIERQSQAILSQARTIEAAIDKLKEYRSALITAAVTGKIDVRQVPVPEAARP